MSAAGFAACALVAGAAVMGLRVPALVDLAGLPRSIAPDYAATYDAGFTPLRRAFVNDVLGVAVPSHAPVESSVTAGRRGVAPAPEGRGNAAPARHDGVRVQHAFTNDDRRDAFVIARLPFTGATNASAGTREHDEPTECTGAGGTAWYRYSAKRAENLIASTIGSDHAVALGVFRAGPGGALELVACDAPVARAAFVQFDHRDSATYFFQLTARTTGRHAVFNLEPAGETSVVYSGDPSDPTSLFIPSGTPTMTSDARYVGFASYDTDVHPVTPRDPCHVDASNPPRSYDEVSSDYGVPCAQAYVLDRTTREVHFVSMSSGGEPGNLSSGTPWMAGSGRYAAFHSEADNLVAGDTNHADDAFVRDLAAGTTERVSVSTSGAQAQFDGVGAHDRTTSAVSISDDGRHVAFVSHASNLVLDDTNGVRDVFVHDRTTRVTARVSVSSSGRQTVGATANDGAVISPGGRFVYFISDASNLAPGANGGTRHSYVHDRATGTTELVSLATSGEPANADSAELQGQPRVSADGRFVVFTSKASNLVPGDRNGTADVFVRDRTARTTSLVSITSSGDAGSAESGYGTISRDGRYVAFTSLAENLAGGSRGDTEEFDLFVRDLVTGTTARMPVAPQGRTFEGAVRAPTLSSDGRSILFAAFCPDGCTPNGTPIEIWLHERPRPGP